MQSLGVGPSPTSVQLAGSIISNLSSSPSPSSLYSGCSQPRFLSGTPIDTHARIQNLTGQVSAISRFAVLCGGFSDIYSGELKGRKVALKLLRVFTPIGILDEGRAKKRLNREIGILCRLDHPNIAQFFGISYQFGERPSIIMQWYDKGNASQYLKVHPDTNRLTLIHDISLGLNYLHTLSPPIVHGDVKGNNVLITDDGRAVLTDFGLSRIIEDTTRPSGNTTGSSPGAVRWQAPEFFTDLDSDSIQYALPSDVWSFGCTIYELISGNLPWTKHSKDWLIIRSLQNGELPVDDSELHAFQHNGIGFGALLSRCWVFSPARRPLMIDAQTHIERLMKRSPASSL